MRKNYPVTHQVYDYAADKTLISITDLKGRITYCNEDFIEISGYVEAELLGQPHNILRHPDMPEETFRDFWKTIQDGRIWSGLIKNRRKNGDSYWVRANATPMRSGDEVVGYLSVRTLPRQDEINAAEKLYARMRDDDERNRTRFTFHRGLPRRSGLLGRFARLLRPSERAQLFLWLLLPVVAATAGSALGLLWWQVALAGLLAGMASWFGISRLLIHPVQKAIAVARRLASGDLSEFVSTQETGLLRELLLSIGQMALATRTVMVDVRSELGALSLKSSTIAADSEELAQRTDRQKSSLIQTAAALEQVGSAIQQASDTTKIGVEITKKTFTMAHRSQETVQSASNAIQEIAESFKKINNFTQTIEAIAFQTNILALNAAVEAARAGEHGRGFTIVAAEVRSLSQRTTSAAREIASLIRNSEEQITSGTASAKQAREDMSEVVQQVERTTQTLEEIDHSASEQAIGIQQINAAMQQLDRITVENAAMVDNLAASLDAINHDVYRAQDNIQVFRITAGDRTHGQKDAVQLRKQARLLLENTPVLALGHDPAVSDNHDGADAWNDDWSDIDTRAA